MSTYAHAACAYMHILVCGEDECACVGIFVEWTCACCVSHVVCMLHGVICYTVLAHLENKFTR